MTVQEPINNCVDNQKWALIPSDPAIFNDMIYQYGVKDIEVEEVCSLDFEEFKNEGKVIHGLMFISKYVEEELPSYFDHIDSDADNVVFTAQVVTNVCATLALLAILFNADVEKGNILNDFLNFTKGFSPINRGLCLGTCKEIRDIHNAYASNANQLAEAAVIDSYTDTSSSTQYEYTDAENYHYISYIYKNGFLWELDGLKYYPVKLAECTEETWLTAVKPVLENRMNSSLDNDLQFSLMAITCSNYHFLKEHHDVYTSCLNSINKIINKETPVKKNAIYYHKKRFFDKFPNKNIPHYDVMLKLWDNIQHNDFKAAAPQMHLLQERVNELAGKLQQSHEEKEAARAEVARQKFDYFPFLVKLFKSSNKHGLLAKTEQKKKAARGAKRSTKKQKIIS
ncbi:MAG: ubiquitin carboxyl-terminal hydrolase [Benjaminiella poitrasii]|nr:MAG: ubiquitin carboxyl-terminal hydrolase [Benjaminiella poitrasii]